MDIRERIDEMLRAEMVTIGIDVDDAKTGQMWAFDSERLSKRILAIKVEENRDCFNCEGMGSFLGSTYADSNTSPPCPVCNGTGILPGRTLKQVLEEL